MWNTKTFKTQQQLEAFIAKNGHEIQYEIIYIDNGYAIEYRKLRVINL